MVANAENINHDKCSASLASQSFFEKVYKTLNAPDYNNRTGEAGHEQLVCRTVEIRGKQYRIWEVKS